MEIPQLVLKRLDTFGSLKNARAGARDFRDWVDGHVEGIRRADVSWLDRVSSHERYGRKR